MAEPKTKPTTRSVKEFLSNVEPKQKRQDGLTLLALFTEITGEKAVMWGTSIVGFGQYHYQSQRSAQQGDWFLVGFSPRKQNLTLYIMHGNEKSQALFKKLGKHKTSMGCVYINKLADVDVNIVKKLIEQSFRHMKMKKAGS